MRARFRGAARRATTVLVLAMLASGCTAAVSTKAASPTTAPPPEQPHRGGVLAVGLDGDPGSLNPAVTTDELVHEASEPMFNGLLRLTAGALSPDLAESWKIEQGGAVYRFTLRDGVKWHDGQPFTSADVKFTFERALLPYHARAHSSLAAAGLTLDAPDARTIVFTFPAPYAPLLQQLDVTEAPILPKHVYEQCADISTVKGCPANVSPVGTGAFKLAAYDPDQVRLVRNPDYYRPDLPYLDGMVERFMPDEAAQVQAMHTHELDWVWHVSGTNAGDLRSDQSISVLTEVPRGPGGGFCYVTLAFNMQPGQGRLPLLVDERVRLALWEATDRREAVDQLLAGEGAVPAYPIHPGLRAAPRNPVQLPIFDPDRARRLLDQVGWKDDGGGVRVAHGVQGVPDGTPLKLDYDAMPGIGSGWGGVLKERWRDVGVDLELRQGGGAGTLADVLRTRRFDTVASMSCAGPDPFVGVRGQYHSSQIQAPPYLNIAGYANAEMDRLWDQSTVEMDPVLRNRLLQRVQALAVRDLPYLWLGQSDSVRAWNRACTGLLTQSAGLFAEAARCER